MLGCLRGSARGGQEFLEEARQVAGDGAVRGHKIAPGGPRGGLPRGVRVPAETEQGNRSGDHGGLQTISTLQSSTPSVQEIFASISLTSCGPSEHPTAVSVILMFTAPLTIVMS